MACSGMAWGHPFGCLAGVMMSLVVGLGGVWVALPWWTCVLHGPPQEDVAVSLWRESVGPAEGGHGATSSVSVAELCRTRDDDWDHFCGRVQAIRVLSIFAVIAAALSAVCMLVGFCGVRRFREGALLKDGAHLAGGCFLLMLVAVALAEYIGTIRLYPLEGHPSGATKVSTNGTGFVCALVGMSLTVPSGLVASLAECRRANMKEEGKMQTQEPPELQRQDSEERLPSTPGRGLPVV